MSMHQIVLSDKQQSILPLVNHFSNEFGLVGGTAIALQLGHRQSIDFDLFKNGELELFSLRKQILDYFPIERVMVENSSELTLMVNGVQLTLLNYPFSIKFTTPFEDIIKMPTLLQLAAMKAFALNKRAKWKDYIDLFFILKRHSLQEIINECLQIYGSEFSEKLFREQLSYFDDIDYSEKVQFLPGNEVSDDRVKEELKIISLEKI